MDLLLLLISTLLSSYFHPGRAASEQQSFTIRDIQLFIEPSTDVTRDTNVTLRCKATVSISGQVALSRMYTISKDGTEIYTKTSLTSDDVLYHLPKVRVSNTGQYRCKINIEDTDARDTKRLTVTGLAKPILRLSREQVKEGEELTARCIAPDEAGTIFFKFYDNSKEILHDSNTQAEAKLSFSDVGIHEISCDYTVIIMADSFTSEKSNNMTVSVKGLSISPVLKISPENDIYEGDQLNISCTISNSLNSSEKTRLQLLQGTIFLGTGDTKINRFVEVKDKNQGEFECILIIGNVKKIANKTLSVTELFSVPALTMSPAEVFQMQEMNLTCKSESSKRLRGEKLTYTLDPPAVPAKDKVPGKFVVTAPNVDINYTCVVQAKNITKHSNALMIHPKVAVDAPQISVVGRAILKQPVKIRCRSNNGSLPINYTLLRDSEPQDTTTVRLQSQDALFTVTITKPEEIEQFRCKAQNRHEHAMFSEPLNDAVIVPLTHLTMIVNPDLADITEGGELYLMCRIEGSPPVTFKFYRVGSEHPLRITTTSSNNTNYQIPTVSKKHSGEYYCEAENHASSIRSERVTIEVRMALWKKVLIGGFCLLVVSVLVVVGVLYFKSKRGKREATSELSVKPSSPKSDDSLTVNLTHDTEVYNAATDAAPLYDGTEGKVTNGVRDSVASLPADISNRSSYSTPATV